MTDPEGYEYPCSWIYTQPEDTQQYSEWYLNPPPQKNRSS